MPNSDYSTLERKYVKTDVGVIVGRFQTPYLHSQHIALLNTVQENHKKVILFLGMSPLLSTENDPLPFEAREQMISKLYPDFIIGYIKDTESDEEWSKKLDQEIAFLTNPKQTVTIYGGRDSFISHYTGKFLTQELIQKNYISGTEIRNEVKNVCINSEDFRRGVIYAAYRQYDTCYPTVDVGVLKQDNSEVLLIRKSGNKLWQFPGGFAEPKSENFEIDAIREVYEETNVNITTPRYLGSFFIDNWRYKKLNSKIKTLFFKAYYTFGSVEAGDDAHEAKWFPFNALTGQLIKSEHQKLYFHLLNDVKNNDNPF